MQILESVAELREAIGAWRRSGDTIAFVPTMGNLHAGHLRLVEEGRRQARRTVVSIFVNPSQFGPAEDFEAYPRTPEQDAAGLAEVGADLLFLPKPATIYPHGVADMTYIEVPGLSDELCGHFRPGHFRGVATVVCKLFNLVQPDIALFGEKDFQQLTVIRRMVADLDMDVHIVGVPTVREASGLAMSSRNGYLSSEEKAQASGLYRSLCAGAEALAGGERDFGAIEQAQEAALRAAGFRPDYYAIRRQGDLARPGPDERTLVILAAAWLGRTRLIDNLKVTL